MSTLAADLAEVWVEFICRSRWVNITQLTACRSHVAPHVGRYPWFWLITLYLGPVQTVGPMQCFYSPI